MEKELLNNRLFWPKAALMLLILTVNASCSIVTIRKPAISAQPDKIPDTIKIIPQSPKLEAPVEAKDAIPSDIEIKIRQAEKQILKDEEKNGVAPVRSIPIEINRRVQAWIKYFTKKDRARFQRFINRGVHYHSLIQSVLTEKEMPSELYYLAMIESGFRPAANSRVGAVGIWQFMPGTGRNYGLLVTPTIDERRDPVRSTRAAAEYLRDLHNFFKSWYLAIAAYNAGEYRIIGAIRKGKTRNFWELVDKRVLPPETMDYVPKFIAATIIAKNPSQYGFTEKKPTPFPPVEYVRVPNGTRLSDISKASKVNEAELRRINPHLVYSLISNAKSTHYQVTVPAKAVVRFDRQVLLQIQNEVRHRAVRAAKIRKLTVKKPKYYRVRKGDTLSSIAARYGMPIVKLKKVNRLRREAIFAGQILSIAKN